MFFPRATLLVLTWVGFGIAFVRVVGLVTNYLKARKIGLPILVTYVAWSEPLWLLFLFDRFQWLRRLPFGLGDWVQYSEVGWTIRDRYDVHKRFGSAFVQISPVSIELVIADPDAAAEVTSDYKKWIRPRELYSLFELFGPNVDSVNGKDWQRHRKVISQGFKEQNNKLAWESGCKQARQMMKTSSSSVTLEKMAHNFHTIAIHILSYAGFNHDYDFDRSSEKVPPGHKQKFADALFCTCLNIFPAWILKSISIPTIITPAWLQEIKVARSELIQYFDESLVEKKGDFVTSIANANENEKSGQDSKLSLNDIEVQGNLFVIQLAGFETTSTALFYSLGLLAVNPQIQDWLISGIKNTDNYEDAFPNVRCLAVMYETIRCYGSVPGLLRYSPTEEVLNIGERKVRIPAEMRIQVNVPAVHHDPSVWGEDSYEWKPQRWIEMVDGVENLKEPPVNGIFMPWSTGPRICPGKKFSQVEFVSVMSNIISQYRVEGSRNVLATLNDFYFRTGPKPRHPELADLKFSRRSGK